MPHGIRYRQCQLLQQLSSAIARTESRCSNAARIRRQARILKSIQTRNLSNSTNHHHLPPRQPPISKPQCPRLRRPTSILISTSLILLVVATATATLYPTPTAHAEAPVTQKQPEDRLIRLSEVRAHGHSSPRKWITHGTSVYDITDWIAAHPGGNVILRAVGGSIDPYWEIFTIHKSSDVYDILEGYRIGELDPQDLVDGKRLREDEVEDPFVNDPVRHESLMQHTEKPCNAETCAESLGSFITPNESFYVRNHLWVPEVDDVTHVLTVELPDGTEKEYSLSDLKSNFQPFSITATLQCAGNRRRQMTEGARPTSGLPWDIGAISNAEWTGVRLTDVLLDAGFDGQGDYQEDTRHAQFVGAEAYGASIPIEKATDPRGDVMLAFAMNGEPIPRDHGFPLRVVVPGNTAARSVKWLEKIILAEDESQSQWQQRDYKCFGPNQAAKDVDWSTAPAIQETPVQSAITSIKKFPPNRSGGRKRSADSETEEDAVEIEGYAFSGGGREVVRVDVSSDGGRSWQQACLLPDDPQGLKRWSWKRWQATVKKSIPGEMYVVKAVDDSYNTQPESYEAQWNFRGNLTTAWHRVQHPVKKRSGD